MNMGPPNWIAWIADIGSIFGFAATMILTFQARSEKAKIQRLVRLYQHLVAYETYCTELNRIIGEYSISGPERIEGQLSRVLGGLRSLEQDLSSKEKTLISPVLETVVRVRRSVTQNGLINVYGEIVTLTEQLEGMVDRAKMNM